MNTECTTCHKRPEYCQCRPTAPLFVRAQLPVLATEEQRAAQRARWAAIGATYPHPDAAPKYAPRHKRQMT